VPSAPKSWNSVAELVLRDVEENRERLDRHEQAIAEVCSDISVMKTVLEAMNRASTEAAKRADAFFGRWEKYAEDRSEEREAAMADLAKYQAEVRRDLVKLEERTGTRTTLISALSVGAPAFAAAVYFAITRLLD
jgi:chromosome segregation ATPase